MNQLRASCLVLFFLGTVSPLLGQLPVASQSMPAGIVEWGQKSAHQLTLDETDSNHDLEPLAGVVGDARVIGLGEAEHGIHEFLMFRNRFVRFAIERLGVTAIAAESGYNESLAVEDYVQGRSEFTMDTVGSVFSWSMAVPYEENRELIEWVRNYNARPTTKRKVHFYGIDLTGGRAGRFVEARHSLDAALAFIAVAEPPQEQAFRTRLGPLLANFATGVYGSLTADQQNALTAAIEDLVALFERRSVTWPAATSHEAFDRAYHSAIVCRQLNANFRAAPAESNPQAQRESAMAENLTWVLHRQEPGGRVLLYAANWHISKGPMATDKWGSSLGEHLQSKFGKDYVTIATAFGEEEETADGGAANESKPDPASAAALMSKVCKTFCWLSFQATPQPGPVADWLNAMRPIQGGRTDQLVVNKAFDTVVFMRKVRAASKLQPN